MLKDITFHIPRTTSVYVQQKAAVFGGLPPQQHYFPASSYSYGSTSLVDFFGASPMTCRAQANKVLVVLKCSEPSATSAECRGTSWCCLYRTTCKQVFRVPTNYAALFLSISLIYFWANGAFLYLIYFFETQSC